MAGLTVDMERVDDSLGLRRRIDAIPESAAIRGVFFGQMEDYLRRELGLDEPRLRELVGPARRSYKMYPARDFARLCAVVGAVVDADPMEGMRRAARGMASYFATTWHGKIFQRLLRPDPFTTLQFVSRSREFVSNYSTLRAESRGPGRATVHIFDEYCWIQAIDRGGCEGMLDACGVQGDVSVELDTPYRGRLQVSWTLPA